jgi:hypothetical protein
LSSLKAIRLLTASSLFRAGAKERSKIATIRRTFGRQSGPQIRFRHGLKAWLLRPKPISKDQAKAVPVTFRDQMEKIVALSEHYGTEELEHAMHRSIGFRAFGYGRLKRILERRAKAPHSLRTSSQKTARGSDELEKAAVGVQRRDLAYYGGGGQ